MKRELNILSVAARKRAGEQLAADLFDLGLSNRRASTSGGGRGEFMRRARRCVAELEEMKQYFQSGRSTNFEMVNRRTEEVTLAWSQQHGCHEVEVIVKDASLSADECAARQKEIEMQLSQLCFVRQDQEAQREPQVYTATRRGRDAKNDCILVIVEPAEFIRGRDIPVRFYASFAREQSALNSCNRLVEAPDSASKLLRVLMRMDDNEPILTEGAADALAAHLEQHPRLNEEQRLVFECDRVRTVQLVHGPPGTGKTSVIDSFLQSPARKALWLKGALKRHVVLVVSEKNHAVDAIAASLLQRGGGEPGNIVWEETVAHGVLKSLGGNSKKFFIEEKAKNDPAVKRADQEVDEANNVRLAALATLQEAVHTNKDIVIAAADKANVTWEDITVAAVEGYEKERFIPVSAACKKYARDPETVAQILCDVLPLTTVAAVRRARDMIDGARQVVVEAKSQWSMKVNGRQAKLKQAATRLCRNASVVLSTLGSSHSMVSALKQQTDLDDDEDVYGLPTKSDQCAETSATIICDEASTVHTPLFIGAVEKLSAQVILLNILVIGDDRQLPPYWPLQEPKLQPTALYSLAADVTPATRLLKQYRMPRFVMGVLNNHFYSDTPLVYAKIKDARLDESRPVWMDVPGAAAAFNRGDRGGRGGDRRRVGRGGDDRAEQVARKQSEESRDEADRVLEEAMRALESDQSVLITTPYKQQRSLIERMVKFEFDLENYIKNGRLVVTTVDGGQGQEADVLIISMVKPYPSKFLDSKRLCVMLSRGRRRLVMVGNRDTHLGCTCKPVAEIAQMSIHN